MISSSIQLSIALVTRNRPDVLRRCLASVRGQGAQPFEIVVSDDSDEERSGLTERVAAEHGCRYERGPRRGLYANRNHAARACRGTHVRTMDDDHTFPAGHLEQCLAAVASAPQSVWTTGEISFVDGRYYATATTANQLHPSGLGCAVADPHHNWAVADGSTIYPSAIFARGLWMAEEYGYGSSYLEFGALVYWCGWRSRCLTGALVEHHADRATVLRGGDRRMMPSQLFASLAYNLCFCPNFLRAMRYAAGCLRRDPLNGGLLRRLPAVVVGVRGRWRAARERAAVPEGIVRVDFRGGGERLGGKGAG